MFIKTQIVGCQVIMINGCRYNKVRHGGKWCPEYSDNSNNNNSYGRGSGTEISWLVNTSMKYRTKSNASFLSMVEFVWANGRSFNIQSLHAASRASKLPKWPANRYRVIDFGLGIAKLPWNCDCITKTNALPLHYFTKVRCCYMCCI